MRARVGGNSRGVSTQFSVAPGMVVHTWCVISVLLFAASASATSVLALIDKKHHRVVLAADSLLVFTRAGKTAEVCKIIAQPGCTFMMAGLFDKEYPVFHLKELAEQACALPGDLAHRADAFLDIAKDPVTEVASYLRQNEPQFYAETVSRNGGEFVIVAFAGTQNGKSVIFARGFKLGSDGSIVPLNRNVTEDNAGIGFFAGSNEHIAAYVTANKKWQKMDRIAAARKFIQLEIDAHPDGVGPPISILTIDHLDRQKWVSPGVCTAPINDQAGSKTNP